MEKIKKKILVLMIVWDTNQNLTIRLLPPSLCTMEASALGCYIGLHTQLLHISNLAPLFSAKLRCKQEVILLIDNRRFQKSMKLKQPHLLVGGKKNNWSKDESIVNKQVNNTNINKTTLSIQSVLTYNTTSDAQYEAHFQRCH